MYPGPRTPYNGYGPRYGGPFHRQMGPGPGRQLFGQMRPPQYRMGPMMGMRPAQPARQGGILAKLLGKGTQHGAGNGAGINGFVLGQRSASKGGLLQTLTNPGALNGFLNNTQQVLKTAQSVGPMIQQYGPLVRNLPAMWKLYRGLKDLPDQEEENEPETKPDKPSAKKVKTPERKEDIPPTSPAEETVKLKVKDSRPKLFI
ncbi:VrrA/YqfQ family protein [Mesobacillus foraminis]|uniref:VrrA/YqfQ family protein n=1 Tax=Mesobacillus foraminis TaxID=279826 RepID=UPI000EF4C461|nr:VrrA/YqfQ family protein [Mesobacillus foraminis]